MIAALFADTDWETLYTGWPFPLAALESRVMTAVNTAGVDAQAVLAAGIAAAREPAGSEAAPVQEAPPIARPPGLSGGGFGFATSQNKAFAEFFHRVEGDQVRGVLRIEIDEGYHLYHTELGPGVGRPAVVTLEAPGVTWNDVVFPEPEVEVQEMLGDGGTDTFVWSHHGTIVVLVTGTLADGAEPPAAEHVSVAIVGQTCDASGCVDYDDAFESDGALAGDAEIDALFANAGWDTLYADEPRDLASREAGILAELNPKAGSDGASGALDPDTNQSDEGEAEPASSGGAGGGLWALILFAIGGGLFALVMPCTYPMIPITISFFTKQAEARNGRVWPLALIYGTGIVAMFTSIGLVVFLIDVFASQLGLAQGDAGLFIIDVAQSDWFNMIIGIMFVYFALVLFGAINLQPPQWALRMVGSAQGKAASGKGGIGGLFLMGALLVVTSFTCTAPFVGSILGAAAQQGGLRVVLGMAVFGLTMALPFVFLSLVPGRVSKLPTAGAWMNTVKVALGFVEVAAAFKFFSNADVDAGWGVLPRELFLWIWAVLALVIAVYLFGLIKVKGESGEIGPARMAVATVFVVLGTYFGYGALGNAYSGAGSGIMTALAPPYSNETPQERELKELREDIDALIDYFQSGAATGAGNGEIAIAARPIKIDDDLDAAKQEALDEGRRVLVNFTGDT